MTTVLPKLVFRAAAVGVLMAAFAPGVRAQGTGDGRITLDPDTKPATAQKPEAKPAEAPAADGGTVAKPEGAVLPVVYPASVEVTGQSVRLRSGASMKYQVVKVLSTGDVLVATAIEDEWISVRMPADAPCWVSSSFVTDLGNGNGVVKGRRVNLRISPNTNHYPVGQVSDKSVRLVLDAEGKPRRNGDWVQIVPPSEAKAYIHRDYVKKSDVPVPAEAPAAAASSDAGTTPAAAADGKPAGGELGTSNVVTPEEAARERARRLLDEARAFRELDKLFLEEISKPQDQRDFSEMKLLYTQYSESADDKDIRARAVERVALIGQTEVKIASMVAEAEKRVQEAKAAAEKAEQDRLARIEELRKAAEAKPAAETNWLATGYIADHGRDAKLPASHALCDANGNVLYYIRWDTGDLNALWQKQVRVAGTSSEHAGWDKPVIVVTSVEECTG